MARKHGDYVPDGEMPPEEIARKIDELRQRVYVKGEPPAVRIIKMREAPLVGAKLGPGYVGYVIRLAFSYAITEKELESILELGFHARQEVRGEWLDEQNLAKRKRRRYTRSS